MYRSAWGKPAWAARAAAVTGLSPRDQLEVHPFLTEVGEGAGGRGAELVGQYDIGQGMHRRQGHAGRRRALGQPGHQHPLALRFSLTQPRAQNAAQPLGRPHHENVLRPEIHGAPLPLGGKGYRPRRREDPLGAKIPLQCLKGGVAVLRAGQEGAHQPGKAVGLGGVCQVDLLHLQPAQGQGAGLVQAEGVHVG